MAHNNARTVRVAVWRVGVPLGIVCAIIGVLLVSPAARRAYEPCRVWVCDTGAELVPIDMGDEHHWVTAQCDDLTRAAVRLPAADSAPGSYRASMCDPGATYVSDLVTVSPGLNGTRVRMYAVADDGSFIAAWIDGVNGWVGFGLGAVGFVLCLCEMAVCGVTPSGRKLPRGDPGDGDANRQWRRVCLRIGAAMLSVMVAIMCIVLFACVCVVPVRSGMCEATTCVVTGRPEQGGGVYYVRCGPVHRAALVTGLALRDGDVVQASQCAYDLYWRGGEAGMRMLYVVPPNIALTNDGIPDASPVLLGLDRHDVGIFITGIFVMPLFVLLAVFAILYQVRQCRRAAGADARALEYLLQHGYTEVEQREADAIAARARAVRAACTYTPDKGGAGDCDADDGGDDAVWQWRITASHRGGTFEYAGPATRAEVFGANGHVSVAFAACVHGDDVVVAP